MGFKVMRWLYMNSIKYWRRVLLSIFAGPRLDGREESGMIDGYMY